MSTLSENNAGDYNWEEGIYQLEVADKVMGGPGGTANRQATELAIRTRNLHERLTEAESEKASLDSPILTGTPTAPTAIAGTNNTQIANTAFVKAAIAALIDSAPGAMDTLNELAAALGDDPNFSATVINALATKLNRTFDNISDAAQARAALGLGAVALLASISIANVSGLQSALDAKSPLASPALTGNPTAPTAASGNNTTQLATTAFVQAAITALGLGALASVSSVAYAQVADSLKSYTALQSGAVNLSENGGGKITLAANTAFSFTGFQLNKTYLLIITANGFTPSWADGTKHVPVDGNAQFDTASVFYVSLTCIDTTPGSEKLLTAIMKGA